MKVSEPTIHIKINQHEWKKIKSLIFDDDGAYRPEIADFETSWNQPFSLWVYMPEGKPLLDLIEEIREEAQIEQITNEKNGLYGEYEDR